MTIKVDESDGDEGLAVLILFMILLLCTQSFLAAALITGLIVIIVSVSRWLGRITGGSENPREKELRQTFESHDFEKYNRMLAEDAAKRATQFP